MGATVKSTIGWFGVGRVWKEHGGWLWWRQLLLSCQVFSHGAEFVLICLQCGTDWCLLGSVWAAIGPL